MNQRSCKLVKIFLSCVMGIITFTGCASTDTPTDPVVEEPTEPVVEKTELELLAEEYELFQWVLDDSKTKIVDGTSYDLLALKQQYGDLYRFVEPLSKEEVEYRFKCLAEYFAVLAEKGIKPALPGAIKTTDSEVFSNFMEIEKEYYKSMANKELGEEFNKFSKYYVYLEKTGKYYEKNPDKLLVESEFINTLDSVPFDDKEWFVRKYINDIDILIRLYKEFNSEISFELTATNLSKVK